MNDLIEKVLEALDRQAPADNEALQALILFAKSELPSDYIELLKTANGAWGWLRGRYLILYSAEKVISIVPRRRQRTFPGG
jgi:hypothetical protein